MVFHKKKKSKTHNKDTTSFREASGLSKRLTTRKHQKEDKDDTNCTTGAAPEYIHLKEVCNHRAHRQSPVWA